MTARTGFIATGLTQAQTDTLRLAADGLSNKEIAARRFTSSETSKGHIKAILQHLGARNRTHAVAIAIRKGLIG